VDGKDKAISRSIYRLSRQIEDSDKARGGFKGGGRGDIRHPLTDSWKGRSSPEFGIFCS